MPQETIVIRNDAPDGVAIDAKDLVVGDIIKVKAGGDKIPADVRIIECSEDMKVEQASLTGEPDHLERKPEKTDDNPLETKNLCFFGTQCPSGKAKCLVVKIGDDTVMGRISALAQGTAAEQTPINKELERFVLLISSIAIFLGITFLIINFTNGTDPISNLVFMIGIIVANVRLAASRRVHETRDHLTSMRVVSFWISSRFGPRRGRRRGDGVEAMPHRLDCLLYTSPSPRD